MALKKKSTLKNTPSVTDKRRVQSRETVSAHAGFRSDSKETNLLIQAAKSATAEAMRSLKALDLPVTYLEKGIVYRRSADGRIVQIASVPKKPAKSISLTLKKGMILHAKK